VPGAGLSGFVASGPAPPLVMVCHENDDQSVTNERRPRKLPRSRRSAGGSPWVSRSLRYLPAGFGHREAAGCPMDPAVRCRRRAPSDKRILIRDSSASGAMGQTARTARRGPLARTGWHALRPCFGQPRAPQRALPYREGPDGHLQQGRARRPHNAGVNAEVLALAPSGSNLYVGGRTFSSMRTKSAAALSPRITPPARLGPNPSC